MCLCLQSKTLLRRRQWVWTVHSGCIVPCVHFNAHSVRKREKAASIWGEKERTREEAKKEEIYCHLFLLCPPSTSPVSPIVLHHNGACLIILKTADYQSGRFQGPTSKQTQQYRTEREFLWTVWAPADYKGRGFKGTPFLNISPQKHTAKAKLQQTAVMSGGGFQEWDAYQENMAASWKEK